MKPQTRDTILGVAGIIVSVCAGVWTLFNYDAEERKIEVNAIFEISKSLEGIKLEHHSQPRNQEAVSRRIHDLYVVVQHKYNLIKKPCFEKSDSWKSEWESFYKNLQTAYTQGYEHTAKDINKHWKNILKKKKILVLEVANEI